MASSRPAWASCSYEPTADGTLFEPDRQRFRQTVLAMAYVAFDVRHGSAAGVARFSSQVFDARIDTTGGEARVPTRGHDQWLD
ncbi:MAG: hypothetical protein LC797_13320 [Chloroflexi bacterium]|nr:hypothetical protein [Chloroflexota bacterium]